MKYSISGIIIGLVSLLSSVSAGEWIRINQLGYLPESPKVAVFMSEGKAAVEEYVLVEVFTGEIVKWFDNPKKANTWGRMQSVYRLDFSDFKTEGTYVLRVGETMSPRFVIGNRVYDGTADFILRYMRQQRCGFNPFERDSCHIHDGYIVYHPTRNGKRIDVRGGWHDASDQLQYVTTSANATYQMMFAYLKNPEVYGDVYDAYGLPGANGIPDIVDEIKWGLDWLNRMNPSKGEMYNQIADDRDHKGFKLPSQDHIDYGWGKGTGRPVYYCSGKPQVRGEFSNATTGVASTAGKYASCFALGAEILKDFIPIWPIFCLLKLVRPIGMERIIPEFAKQLRSFLHTFMRSVTGLTTWNWQPFNYMYLREKPLFTRSCRIWKIRTGYTCGWEPIVLVTINGILLSI